MSDDSREPEEMRGAGPAAPQESDAMPAGPELLAVEGREDAWPDARGLRVVFLLDAASSLERRLLEGWVQRRKPAGMPAAIREAAIGTEPVVQTYNGREIASTSNMPTIPALQARSLK